MWMMMMDSNSDKESKLPADPLIGRKLRPLMPRPIYSTPSCCYIRNPNIPSWNHSISDHHAVGIKREIQSGTAAVSTRWNPTPEQLQTLEEMYRRGIRTPSAEQIQQIAAKLRRFGKIEGKNVFYWFQNHKARERQKKRRQLELPATKKRHHAHTLETNHQTPAGLSRRYFKVEPPRKVPIPSNCTTPSEDSASMQAAVIAAECGKDGWNHKEELEPKVARNELGGCCWQLDLDVSSSPPINAITAGQENTKPYPYAINHENQTTLELFPRTTPPPRPQQHIHIPPHTFTNNITPTHFIEFLPIKN